MCPAAPAAVMRRHRCVPQEAGAFILPGNEAFRRLTERLGMRPAGAFDHPQPQGHALRRHPRRHIAAPPGG